MEKAKNKIGIICDNYKVRKYKRKLKSKGYEFETFPQGESLTVIKIDGEPSEQPKIQKICEELELYFKAKRN